jgi:hypothetical protein
MKDLSTTAKVFILGTLLIGLGLIARMVPELDWANPGLYLLAVLGAAAQTLKVEGPNARTNYSIAWFVYGFAFIELGPWAALFVIVIAHLVEWIWHKYPWYIQCFNIANHAISASLAGLVFQTIGRGPKVLDLSGALGLAVAALVFVFGNHLLVGVVVKLARGQSFAESGVLGFLTLFLDFSVLSMGTLAALVWRYNPFVSVLSILPLYLLYNALRVPALQRQLQEMKNKRDLTGQVSSGD